MMKAIVDLPSTPSDQTKKYIHYLLYRFLSNVKTWKEITEGSLDNVLLINKEDMCVCECVCEMTDVCVCVSESVSE